MEIDISKQEAWKLMDAINAYLKDYTVTGPVGKTFDNITKKLKGIVKDQWCNNQQVWATLLWGLYVDIVENMSSNLLRMFIRLDRSLYDGDGTIYSY